MEVKFWDRAEQRQLEFVVIVSRHNGKWVFCKHKERSTYECPGGHIEPGETAETAARRELYEETGAGEYSLNSIGIYSVRENDGTETFGALFAADIRRFGELPAAFEMERITLFEKLPDSWTYPLIQPIILKRAAEYWGL